MRFLDKLAADAGDPSKSGVEDMAAWQKMVAVPLFCQPGEGYRYSIGTGIAAVVASKVRDIT